MEARLGAGVIRVEIVARPLGHEAFRQGRAAVWRFYLSPLDPETTVRNPGFDERGSDVHES
jgi:hypothetical protein